MDTVTNNHPAPPSTEELNRPEALRAFRGVRLLVGAYLAVSVLTLAAIVLLRHHPSVVDSAVWTRVTIVVVSALVMFLCVVRAARGSRPAYRRLRALSAVMVAVIVVIVVLPGVFPAWLKAEQGLCGLLLLGVVAMVNGRHLRGLFSGR